MFWPSTFMVRMPSSSGDDHLADEEEVVQRIEGVDRAGAAHCDHGRAHLAAEDSSVSHPDHAGAVDQRLDLRRHVGDIGRRAEQDAVRRRHLVDEGVAIVVGLPAVPVLACRARAAGHAAMDLRSGQLHEFGFDAFRFQFAEHVAQQDRGVAVLSRTAVERDYFHVLSSAPKSVLSFRARSAPGNARSYQSRNWVILVAG
jgi:hypothetical protein